MATALRALVSRRPERTAIVYGDQTWSYAQLNARSNQLAHLLRLGVKKDELGELGVYADTRVRSTRANGTIRT